MEELVEKAKNGDKEAYTMLIMNIKKDLYKMAKNKVKEKEDVEDIIQETILTGYLKIKQLRNNNYFKTWIIRILLNECNKFYRKKRRNEEISSKYLTYLEPIDENEFENNLEFELIVRKLSDIDQKIMRLYYEEEYSCQEIAKMLGINANTIKSKLSRGRKQIMSAYQKLFMKIIILFVVTTGVVFGKDIINYLKEIFNLSAVGQNNQGILTAIEEKELVQNVEMEYIELDNNYKIKVEYMLLDEMNLYLVFKLESAQKLEKYDRISILDLEIEDELGHKIWKEGDWNNKYIVKVSGNKGVEATDNYIKELIYMISDEYPESRVLKIRFSRVLLYSSKKPNEHKYELNTENQEFEIKVDEKIHNRNTVQYKMRDEYTEGLFSVKKAIISDTGFYAIVSSKDEDIELILQDDKNNKYKCYTHLVNIFDEYNNSYFIVSSNFADTSNEEITLKNKNEKKVLIKK